MAIIKNFIKKYLGSNLGNSIGMVTRNYSKMPEFNPQSQVRGITYKAIDKIGQSVSVYKPQILKQSGEPYTNHPILTLFNNPNPNAQAPDFIHLWAMLQEIYGESFWYLARGENTGRVKEVYLLNPAQVELKIDNGELVGYVLHKNDGQQVPLEIEEIIHDKKPNPFNEWRGLSVLEMAAIYVNTEIVTSNFTLNYIRNSGSPSGIVSLPDMDREAFKQFAQQWRESYEGPQNAGKTAFIRGEGAKFQAVGATLQDIDQKVVREMAKEDVLMMLDLPKPLLGATDDKGFGRGNVETLKYIFAESKLEPMMNRLDGIYTRIAKYFGRDGNVTITHESPIPEDKEFIHKQQKDLVNIALTVNEVRAQMGLEPIDGGDELNPNNKVTPTPVTQSLKIVKKKALTKAEEEKAEEDKKEEFRVKLVDTSELYAKKIKSEISSFAEKQSQQVIEKINASSKSYEEWLFSIKEESEVLATILIPLFEDLFEAQAEGAAHFITGELITMTEQTRAILEANVKQLAGIYNADTIQALNNTLTQGQANGESLVKLKKRVEQVYSDAKGYRAERIARTESLRLSNQTAEQVYSANGYTQIEWFVNYDACEFCQTFAGRTKEIGAVYNKLGDVIIGTNGGQLSIDYSDIDTPPLHPNCKCSIIPK